MSTEAEEDDKFDVQNIKKIQKVIHCPSIKTTEWYLKIGQRYKIHQLTLIFNEKKTLIKQI